jgi:hypothetical protein
MSEYDRATQPSTPDTPLPGLGGRGPGEPPELLAGWDDLDFLIVVEAPAGRRAYGPFGTAEHAVACYATTADLINPGRHGSRLFPLSPPLAVLPAPTPTVPAWATSPAVDNTGRGWVVLVDRPSTADAVLVGPFPAADAAQAWWASQQPAFPGARAYRLPVLPPPDPAPGLAPVAIHVRAHYPSYTRPTTGRPGDR